MKNQIIILILSLSLVSCGKEFLEIRQVKNQVVPQTIEDFQAVLDNDFFDNSAHSLGTNGADEYRITESRWEALASVYNSNLRNIYVWSKEGIYGLAGTAETNIFDWTYAYYYIFCANQALEGIQKIKPTKSEQLAWNNVKGSALFFRAYRYYQLAQEFCPPYGAEHMDSPYGLPLRTSPEVTDLISRSSLQETYDLIIRDLKEAVELLPVNTINPRNYIRPSKAAPLALLAKVYLVMGNYEEARKYASLALELRNELLNFNDLVLDDPEKIAENTFEFDKGVSNPEVIYFTAMPRLSANALYAIVASHMMIDPYILSRYGENDLRKIAYFKPYSRTDERLVFRGSYGAYFYFSGLAVDELYLIRAECNARLNQTSAALQDLNHLLKHRMATGTFTAIAETDPEKLLRLILLERRKELFFRGVRWEDLRRLNQDPRFAITLVREIGGQRYELPPNDPRYTWPIPPSEIDAGGLVQNPR